MTTNYDHIAEEYQRAKLQPWRTYIERYTLLNLIGNVSGRSAIDLACGEGFYTRLLRLHGASPVTGVDLSPGMIELAQRQELAQPLGINYVVQDCRNLQLSEPYDIAVAGYLLNYARNRDELSQMCQSIAGSLKPGGRFVTVNNRPGFDFRNAPSYRQYGFETYHDGAPVEGMPITWKIVLDEGPIFIENYFIDVAVHERAFREAGFREVHWHPPLLAAAAIDELGADYWRPFMEFPPVAFIECIR
ncbi:MAG: methyltransferase domain-containing protein [Pirellulales bacterium]